MYTRMRTLIEDQSHIEYRASWRQSMYSQNLACMSSYLSMYIYIHGHTLAAYLVHLTCALIYMRS